ncbi:MAG: hypothetical protein CM15mV1_0150 [uncultured marine virus]|nr:MAG: hypothetical protein CM15mV1_0150 [uncultured marine virus]
MISPTQLHQNQIDYVFSMHQFYTEPPLSAPNTDLQSHLSMSNPKDFKSSWEYINFYDSEETLNASYYADLVDHLVEQMTTPKPIEPIKTKEHKKKTI